MKDNTFIRKNDIGVDIEYTVVARYKSEDREYLIYTDFVSDEKDIYRLFVDIVNGNDHVPLSETGREAVLEKYREELKKYVDSKGVFGNE